jgi:hypothetical protein
MTSAEYLGGTLKIFSGKDDKGRMRARPLIRILPETKSNASTLMS